ncbi:hypothetical protein EYF80_059539 [Liparis tanakae]|uniref:Uncharacterized protein n=1 Tax=Liparis tanakae TaxID=230148 RepID=A0A4Z2EP00_9TELE|nr:hypothetical protein EYF80_059539 [Liparis tanakae]
MEVVEVMEVGEVVEVVEVMEVSEVVEVVEVGEVVEVMEVMEVMEVVEGASDHLYDGRVEEVVPEHGGVDGGRHEEDPDLRVGLDHVPQDHHQEVRLHTHTQGQGWRPQTWSSRPDPPDLVLQTWSRWTHVEVSLVDLVNDHETRSATDTALILLGCGERGGGHEEEVTRRPPCDRPAPLPG